MVLAVSGAQSRAIRIKFHDGRNVYVRWRLRQLAKAYLKHYQATYAIIYLTPGFSMAVAEACNELGINYSAVVLRDRRLMDLYGIEGERLQELEGKAITVHEHETYQEVNDFLMENTTQVFSLYDKDNAPSATADLINKAYEKGKDIINLWDTWERRKESSFPFSNLQKVTITYGGEDYPSVENYFQAMKTTDTFLRHRFTLLTPVEALQYGKTIEVRPDWDDIQVQVMEHGLKLKFKDRKYMRMLLASGSDELIYWNSWHDSLFGVCYCRECQGIGENRLGKMLMGIRDSFEEGGEDVFT